MLTCVIMVDAMAPTREVPEQAVAHAPVVWRSTLRGVLVLDGDLRLLEGLAATLWLALDEGARTPAELHQLLAGWDLDVDRATLNEAVAALVDHGLLVR